MDQPILHAKIKAFGWHFLYSAVLVGLAALLIYSWYPKWLFELDGGAQILYLIVPIDLVLGPCLMFVVFNPVKSIKEKALDVGIILVLQWCALGFGLWQAMQNRPLALYFNGAMLSSCPQSWYELSSQPKPTHPLQEIQIFDKKNHANFNIISFTSKYSIGECALSDKMVAARDDLTTIKRQELSVLFAYPQIKPQVGQVAMLYQGSYGKAVLLLDEKTLNVIRTVKI